MVHETKKFANCRVPLPFAILALIFNFFEGGYPFIAAGHADNLDALTKEVEIFKNEAPKDTKWGLGLISYSALGINKVWNMYTLVAIYRFTWVSFVSNICFIPFET